MKCVICKDAEASEVKECHGNRVDVCKSCSEKRTLLTADQLMESLRKPIIVPLREIE